MSDSITVKSEEDVAAHKPIMLFGRDILQITCFRSSFICGICTGVVGGLACFLATSKTLFSTHMSFASLWVGVFAYWIPCRYQYESKRLLIEKLAQERRKSKKSEQNEDAS